MKRQAEMLSGRGGATGAIVQTMEIRVRTLSDEGERIVADVARRHGTSHEAVTTLLAALFAGNGTQAQFSHPDLGGMGQWSRGGMIMVGDMFNHELRHRVDALCTELSDLLRTSSFFAATPATERQLTQPGDEPASLLVRAGSSSRWPAELGLPSSSGSQNDLHYAVFPAKHRLAIENRGELTIYDTADWVITGFSQQQSDDQSLSFTSQHGLVGIADLAVVSDDRESRGTRAPEPAATAQASGEASTGDRTRTDGAHDDVFAKIERLADLRHKDFITETEFEAKKAELLARL